MTTPHTDVADEALETYESLQQLQEEMKESDVFKEYAHIVSNISSVVYTFHMRAALNEIEATDDHISLDEHTQKNLRLLANLYIDMQHHEYVAGTPNTARNDVTENSPEQLQEKLLYRNPITTSIFTWVLSHPKRAVTWFEIQSYTEHRHFSIEYVLYYLEQLEEKGLIDTQVDERDGNSVTFYTLTDDGFETAKSVGTVETAGTMHHLYQSVDFGEKWETYSKYDRPTYDYEWMNTPITDT